MMLMFHLAYQIEDRFLKLPFKDDSKSNNEHEQLSQSTNPAIEKKSKLNIFSLLYKTLLFIIRNFSFIFLVLNCATSLLDLYYTYSMISVILSPYKAWFLVLAFYLRYKCSRLNSSDFYKFVEKSSMKATRSDEEVQMRRNRNLRNKNFFNNK